MLIGCSLPFAACSTSLHFVRCIKPNAEQLAGSFDEQLILHQLRCCGVLEVARIARAGYPTRYRHREFAERYKLLLPDLGPGEETLCQQQHSTSREVAAGGMAVLGGKFKCPDFPCICQLNRDTGNAFKGLASSLCGSALAPSH